MTRIDLSLNVKYNLFFKIKPPMSIDSSLLANKSTTNNGVNDQNVDKTSNSEVEFLHVRFVPRKNIPHESRFRVPSTKFSVPLSSTPSSFGQLIDDLIVTQSNNNDMENGQLSKSWNFVSLDTGSLFHQNSLSEFIQTQNLSIENVIGFEYFEAIHWPQRCNFSLKHSDCNFI